MFESYRHRRVSDKGARLLGEARWQEAADAFRQAIELDPGDSWSHNNLAIALVKNDEFEDAAQAFQRAIHMNPGFGESHVNRAGALAQLERWDEAAAVYRRASELTPADPTVRVNMGMVLFHAERWAEAASALQGAVALGAATSQLHTIRASALVNLERWGEATEALRCAIALAPDRADLHASLASALIEQQRLEEAADALREAIELDESPADHHASLANVLAGLGRNEEAAQSIEQAIAEGGAGPESFVSLANALSNMGQKEPAVDALQHALELTPDLPELHGMKGTLLVQLARWGEAALAFQKAIELDPNNPGFFKSLGACLYQAESWDGAASAYRHALALDASDAEAYTNLASVLTRLEPSADTLEAYEQLVELSPDDAAAHLELGVELCKVGRYEEAVDRLERSGALAPSDASSRFLRVDPLLRLGRPEEAVAAHREAIALGGDVPSRPEGDATTLFQARREAFWTPENLHPEVFRTERWLEQLAHGVEGGRATRPGRLLFVLDNDYGELTTLMYLVLGQELAEESVLLLPERLVANNGDALPGRTHGWTSVDDILGSVDAEQPEVVFLCSGYLFPIHDLLAADELERLTEALRERGCQVVTADPFLGTLSIHDPAEIVAIHIPEASEELDLEEMRRIKKIEDKRLRTSFTRCAEIFRDAAHLYPAFPDLAEGDAAASDARNVSFFNPRLLLPEASAEDEAASEPANEMAARPHWLFVLSRTDYETQIMFEGPRFVDLVAQRLVDALAAGRHPILIAPDELVQQVTWRIPTVEGVDILSFCPFNQMISLLMTAEHAFYWNVVSHSILIRLFNEQPVVLFDHGHLVRNVPVMLPRVLGWYYQGLEPGFRDHHEPLTLETVDAWTEEQAGRASRLVDRFRRAPSPDAMVEELLGETAPAERAGAGER